MMVPHQSTITETRDHFASEFSEHDYIEYRPGNLPLVLSVPHGGALRPSHLPNRSTTQYTSPQKREGSDVSHYASSESSPTLISPSPQNESLTVLNSSPQREFTDSLKSSPPQRFLQDLYTRELAELLSNHIESLCQRRPHMVICHLARSKLDPNRDKAQGACGLSVAESAWDSYHRFLEGAVEAASQGQDNVPSVSDPNISRNKPVLILDLHGQNHPEKWVELGYLLSSEVLDSQSYDADQMSVRSLVNRVCHNQHRDISGTYQSPSMCSTDTNVGQHMGKNDVINKCGKTETDSVGNHSCSDDDRPTWPESAEQLIAGKLSLGGLLANHGYKVIPSPQHPSPQGGQYYSGQYITQRHGSWRADTADAIQVECPLYVRQPTGAVAFSKALGDAVYRFLQLFYMQ